MPTLVDLDSFQHQVLRIGTVPTGSWYTVSTGEGSTIPCHDGVRVVFDETNGRTADHTCSLKVTHSATAGQATQVRRTFSGGAITVVSFYFKSDTSTNPTGNVENVFQFGAPTNGLIGFNSSGQVTARVGTGTIQASSTDYCDAQWHRIDAKYDRTTTSGTLDVQVDGSAITQATGTVTTGNATDWNFGGTAISSAAYTVHYSDLVVSNTSGDYPIGDHICKALEINGTGTHSQGAGAFQDEAGNTSDAELLNSVDDAWDGTTPNLTQTGEDHVKQTVNDANGYVEFTLEDPADSTIWDVMLSVLMAALDSATGCNSEGRLVHSGTTLATTELVDASGSSSYYNGYRKFATRPAGDWDGTKLGASVIRWGFSVDNSPDPCFNSALVEYAAPWSGSTQLVIQDASHAHAADNIALTQHNVLAVQDASHGHTADNIALTQHNVLAIQDALHGHAADNIVLTQHNVLAVQDALHGHAADNVVLTYNPAGALTIQDAAHGHAADNVVLAQHNILVIQDASHSHAADNLALTQHNILVVQDASHGHTADNIVLTVGGAAPPTDQHFVRLRRRRRIGSVNAHT